MISFNCYDFDASPVIDAYSMAGKPCLISEFSFRGDNSGLPNTRGAGPQVATQSERAQCFERYVVAALRKPNVVGYHWFEHADQPAEGRFDGENSNFGVVSITDGIYAELTEAMTRVNDTAEQMRGSCPGRPGRELMNPCTALANLRSVAHRGTQGGYCGRWPARTSDLDTNRGQAAVSPAWFLPQEPQPWCEIRSTD